MDQQRTKPWPEACAGAVSLTFDDGHPSQLERAVPVLNEFGLSGTFYLNPRGATEDKWRARLAPWRAVQAAGHEIGNHSLSHVCSYALRDRRDPSVPALEKWTLADVEADVLEAERRLDAALPLGPGQRRSFCYPCYHEHVGEGLTRHSYVPIIARHFVAGRGLGEFPENRPATCDLHYLWSWPLEFLTEDQIVGCVERAAEGPAGRWVILVFHAMDGRRRTNTEPALRALCAYLVEQRQRLWTAPVATVAQRVAAWRTQHGAEWRQRQSVGAKHSQA